MIGASAILGYGHPTRQTDDVDIWRPASDVNDRQIARAAQAAGIAIDRGTELPEGVYLQLIEPGVVQLPEYENGLWATGEKVQLWKGNKLTVEAPPPSIVAAAKLVRAAERDIDDCVYLVRAKTSRKGRFQKPSRKSRIPWRARRQPET